MGKCQDLKYHEFSLKVLIFSMLQYEDINFYLFIIQLTVYNGTITRFIPEDKVVYQRDERCHWLQTTAENDVL